MWGCCRAVSVVATSNPLTNDAYTRYYAYDAAGRLTRYTDRMGRTTEYTYFASGDAEGRIQFEKWYAAGDDPDVDDPVRVIEYGYTYADGHLVGFTVDDSDVDFVYSYDAAGYLTSVAWDFAGLTVAPGLPDVTLAHQYASGDLVGTQAAIGATADFRNEYAHDSFGRLTQVTQTGAVVGNPVADKRADFAYTDAGQLKTITRYADLGGANLVATSTFTYDPSLGWLAGLVHTINNTNEDIVAYAYTHQPDGQIDTLALDRDVDDVQSSETYDFDYDQQGQLTQVDYTGTGTGVDESYQYDSNGNRVGATVGSSSSVYTPGAYNRLESVDDGTTVTVFGYDPEGNLVLRFVDVNENGAFDAGDTDIVEYTWDHRNRLVSVTNYDTFSDYATNPSQEVEYAYDYLNRLVVRAVDGDREYFVYDHDASTNWGLKNLSTSEEGTIPFGANPSTDSGQIVLQLDENGSPTHRYLWGPAVDMLLADEAVNSGADQTPGTADDVRWTLSDHQNSVRDILVRDDNGTPGYPDDDEWRVGNHVTYDAWGNTLAETDAAISCLFGWTGRLRDKLTGLQNNGNRWYDAVLAHWQSEDPISFAAGDANLYRYCGNDPLNWIDPSGLERYPWQSMGGWNPFSWPIVRMVPNLLTGNSDIYGRRDGEIARKNEDARIRLLSYDVDFSRNYDRFQRSQFKEAARLSAEKATDGVTVIAASASMASASVPRTPLGPSQYGPSQTGRVLPTKPPLVGQGVPKNPASVPLGPKVKPGTYVYVQDGSGVVHVVPNGQHLHPTVLGGGQPGAAAGELVVGRGGVVTEINNISYTFQFGQEVLPGVRDAVLRQGFRVAPDAIKPFTH